MSNVPNLDCLSSEELMDLWFRYSRATRKEAADLVGRRKGYTSIVGDLAHYAANKATAMSCRLRGEIQSALIYEGICDRIYDRLPPDCRW